MLLPPKDVEDFFRLHSQLLAFIHIQSHPTGKRAKKPKPFDCLFPNEIYQLHKRFAEDHAAWIAAYLKADPDRLPASELAEVAAWKDAVTGRFIFLRQLKKHLIVIETEEQARVFGVLGLHTLIKNLFPVPLPALGECTLLPFRGKIVCDGMIWAYPISLGAEMRRGFEDIYRLAKLDGSIITTFDSSSADSTRTTTTKRAAPTKKKVDPLQRLAALLRKRLVEYRKERKLLLEFESEVLPAFDTWLNQNFSKERKEETLLHDEIVALQEEIDRLSFGPGRKAAAEFKAVKDALAEINSRGRKSAEDENKDDDTPLTEPPMSLLKALFEAYMLEVRGVDPAEMDEKEMEAAFEQFRETFRHAADGNHAAIERTLLGVGADRSPEHIKEVNSAYRRIAKRIHPDKTANYDEVASELWEALRKGKIALDLKVIKRVEIEWRVHQGEAFVKDDEPGLKTLQAQLREDLAGLKDLRQELETHPMWGREEKTPSKELEQFIRTDILAGLESLRRWKSNLELHREYLRKRFERQVRASKKSTAKKSRTTKTAAKSKSTRSKPNPK